MSDYVIECHRCAAGDEEHRSDCLLALLEDIEAEPGREVLFDEAEVKALQALQLGGLIPQAVQLPRAVEDLPALGETGS